MSALRQKLASRSILLSGFAGLSLISFLLRIPYAGHLFIDDGLWFTAAEEILRGKALYLEIYFDKPPVLPLLYAGLFKVFGPHILTIRLFTIVYAIGMSAMIYVFGAWLYNRRTGLVAAAFFTVFSTTGHTSIQVLNTDLLMTLPYTASAYLLIRSRTAMTRATAGYRWLAFVGGALAGLAFQVNPKGIFNLFFFAALLIVVPRASRGAQASGLFLLSGLGFITGSLPFLVYVAATGSLSAYWLYLWVWGFGYASYFPFRVEIMRALLETANFFALNNLLLVTLLFVVATMIRRARDGRDHATTAASTPDRAREGLFANNLTAQGTFESDLTLLVWFASSYAALATGGRFLWPYFLLILPSLCLIGARGLMGIVSALKTLGPFKRRAAFAMLITGFAFTLVRLHGRTAVLASDWLRGRKSQTTVTWFPDQRNHEERLAAAIVREWPLPDDASERLGLEAMRAGDTRPAGGASDFLFVWGNRPQIYYWSGLLPASRYLAVQPLTGIPSDVHYFPNERKRLFPESVMARERAQLIQDLRQTKPKFIIDDLGGYTTDLSIQSYPELREFMNDYELAGRAELLLIYRRRDMVKNGSILIQSQE